MPDLRLGVQWYKGDRWWYTLVANEDEAYSAIEDLRIPHPEEMEAGLTFRRFHDFRLEKVVEWEWVEWRDPDDEEVGFKEWCEEYAAWMVMEQSIDYEQEMIADGDIPAEQ